MPDTKLARTRGKVGAEDFETRRAAEVVAIDPVVRVVVPADLVATAPQIEEFVMGRGESVVRIPDRPFERFGFACQVLVPVTLKPHEPGQRDPDSLLRLDLLAQLREDAYPGAA